VHRPKSSTFWAALRASAVDTDRIPFSDNDVGSIA
jgi:hypothetical protein